MYSGSATRGASAGGAAAGLAGRPTKGAFSLANTKNVNGTLRCQEKSAALSGFGDWLSCGWSPGRPAGQLPHQKPPAAVATLVPVFFLVFFLPLSYPKNSAICTESVPAARRARAVRQGVKKTLRKTLCRCAGNSQEPHNGISSSGGTLI